MKSFKVTLNLLPLLFFSTFSAYAHFGMVIPSDNMVMPEESRNISVQLSFSHPFEQIGMKMEKPIQFDVYTVQKKESLLDKLNPVTVMDFPAWQSDYKIKRPGAYIFVMEPAPYWEPSEDAFIIHYTKTVVAAFGDDEGWDREIGMKTEIVPLSKPFALYSGNLFQGIVKVDGKAVPYAEVEIEFLNDRQTIKAPTDYMITQTIKADQNGVFSYSVPAPGWWGFAALTTAKETINHNGKPKPVEQGAVIWTKFEAWQEK